MNQDTPLQSKNRWYHRWVSPKAKAFRSPIEGWGIVAVEPISKQEVVCVFGGDVVHSSTLPQYRKSMGHIGFQIDDNFFLVPRNIEEIAETGAFNHSCDQNVGFVDTVKIVATKDIKAGEELTVDYAFMETNFEPFECKCGNANCRKLITPDDWKIPEIQKKYGEYFSPYLKRKFTK